MSKLVFSMDVEDWYHSENVVHYLSGRIANHSSLGSIDKVLEILRDKNVRGTFFILGCVADKNRNMVKELAEEGHEIANHGWDHTLLNELNRDQTYDDLKKSTDVLESIVDTKILGYRSPCFSVNDSIFEVLNDLGYQYTSMGIIASLHDRYRNNGGYRNKIIDLGLPTASIFGFTSPATGGGWFRLFPLLLQKLLIARSSQEPKIFYCHPWDFDNRKPKVASMPYLYRFRHSVNTRSSFSKLEKLEFSSKPIKDYVKGQNN